MTDSKKREGFGSANGNRTRISALKGPRANRCTIAPLRFPLGSILTYGPYFTGVRDAGAAAATKEV